MIYSEGPHPFVNVFFCSLLARKTSKWIKWAPLLKKQTIETPLVQKAKTNKQQKWAPFLAGLLVSKHLDIEDSTSNLNTLLYELLEMILFLKIIRRIKVLHSKFPQPFRKRKKK